MQVSFVASHKAYPNIACTACITKDFGKDAKYTLETVCFLADFRDAEKITLPSSSVAELRKIAKSEFSFSNTKVMVKKDQLIALLVKAKCF